ncbi:c-type cytochrome [Paenibacillus guangzhouensis]|uniref:c-type cytochrome n=1 Tax=Paenibacillus guangzhouensis TaxID=1473112 RepID=UPI001D11ABB1|nr:cytochrome c [Paenibacillus guangzhouensis]
MKVHKLRTIGAALMLGTALLVLSACGSSGGSAKTEATVEGPEATVTLFKQKCMSCHAADLSGRMGPDTNLTKVGAKMTKEEIVTQIAEGSNKMPAFKKMLEQQEIEQLADWLSTKK